MSFSVTLVSGPRQGGKSALIRTMLDRMWTRPPHYIRLTLAGTDKTRPPSTGGSPQEHGVASARWVEYRPEHAFDVLNDIASAIRRTDPKAAVVVEADADPDLRCAYSYDQRIFVMPRPNHLYDVFRRPREAASEMEAVLADTAVFASEIFGLFQDDALDTPTPREERSDLTETQMRRFLYTPLGDELATRIQLQPPYHGLIESDVVVVTNNGGVPCPASDDCIRQMELLFERLQRIGNQPPQLFLCDPRNHREKTCKQLLKTLKTLCVR